MTCETGRIVVSKAGRDKGERFYVKEVLDENYVALVNGKNRKLESPKKKKMRHVGLVQSSDDRVGEKLRLGEKVTNAEIRRSLAQISGQGDPGEQEGVWQKTM